MHSVLNTRAPAGSGAECMQDGSRGKEGWIMTLLGDLLRLCCCLQTMCVARSTGVQELTGKDNGGGGEERHLKPCISLHPLKLDPASI